MRVSVGVVTLLCTGIFTAPAFGHTGEVPTEMPIKVEAPEAPPAPPTAVEQAAQEVSVEALMSSVVKITNTVANIFEPSPQQSHGTGFFVGLDPKSGRGLIFTNKHVIDSIPLQAQQLKLEFNTQDPVGETVSAKLIYVSNVHDFAVLEFDVQALKRAKPSSQLKLPSAQSPLFDFVRNARALRGYPVLAIGNPFDGSNVVTYGEVTGLQMREVAGPFIQTQTPINPGNSGGPLISRLTGEVVGINTAIYNGANSVGFATPIGPVMKEFMLWRHQRDNKIRPDASASRVITFKSGVLSDEQLKVLGLYDAVTAAIPDYWNNHRTVLTINDVITENGLQKDDILLRMDGEVIGGFPYNLFKRLQRSGEIVEVEVLRNGQLVKLKVPFRSAGYAELKNDVDFVYISGMFLREMPSSTKGRVLPGVNSVVSMGGVVDSAETRFLAGQLPNPGSIITAVNFGGEDYPIESLFDLKKAVNANRDKSWIKLRVHSANMLRTKDGFEPLRSPATGMPLLDATLMTVIVPMREVLTPFQFSIHRFKKQFGFTQADAATWDWRDFRHPERLPSPCSAALAK
ncbi:MAG: trypsin-like peptidase domain-containing protein [Bdellovibrionales bacterium]|nr:trypsin-like peptidase domain-containing protein [Bdellovibrionales bacterium]